MAGGYDTLEDAAAAAQMYVRKNDAHVRHEFISVLYQDPETGMYLFTEPQSQARNDKSKAKVTVPKGSMRGVFHNHPEGDFPELRKYFSEDDVRTAEQNKVQSFIDVDNELFSWDPVTGRKKTIRLSNDRAPVGVGSLTLAQIPMDQLPKRRTAIPLSDDGTRIAMQPKAEPRPAAIPTLRDGGPVTSVGGNWASMRDSIRELLGG